MEVPETQTCCGQPAYNSGDRATALALARKVIDEFEGYEYVVLPSGSCAGMLKLHYAKLLADDPAYAERAKALRHAPVPCADLIKSRLVPASSTTRVTTLSRSS